MIVELDPVDRITADAVGPPGQRVFYLQARQGSTVMTLLLEKQQVQLLAASVVEILSRVGRETGQGPEEEEMGLEEPVAPAWRAGRLSIGYEEERDLLVLEAEEVVAEEEDPAAAQDPQEEPPGAGLGELLPFDVGDLTEFEASEEDEGLGEEETDLDGPEPRRARFWATREQMLSLARHGAAVCARGRPRCQLCGNPMEPEGHTCPALNGHAERTST